MHVICAEHGIKHWHYMKQHSVNLRPPVYGQSQTVVLTADGGAGKEMRGQPLSLSLMNEDPGWLIWVFPCNLRSFFN